MEDLSLHIMDLVDHSIAAGCSHVRIDVREDPRADRESGGELRLDSRPGRGTRVRAVFGLRHVDRKPPAYRARTLRVFRASDPEIRFEHRRSLTGEEGDHETQA